jgi:hypothetical protein
MTIPICLSGTKATYAPNPFVEPVLLINTSLRGSIGGVIWVTGVSAEIEKADLAKLGTVERRQILVGFIRQGDSTVNLRPGCEGRRECLGD